MFDKLLDIDGGRGPDLEHFRRFCMVMEAGGNMAKAAIREKKRNPARRRSAPNDIANDFRLAINRLERTFRVELIKNTGRGACEVTPAGRCLYLTLTEYAAALDMVGKDAEAMPDELSVVCSGGGFIDWQWNPRQGVVKTNFPDVRFAIVSKRTSELIERIKGAEADIGIMDKDRVPKGFKSVDFPTTRFALFVPKNLIGRKKLDVEGISSLPMAGLDHEGKHMRTLREESARHGYRLNLDTFFGGFPQIFSSLIWGEFAAVLPEYAGCGFALDRKMRIERDLPFLKALERENVIVWNERLAGYRQYLPKAAKLLKKSLLTPLPSL